MMRRGAAEEAERQAGRFGLAGGFELFAGDELFQAVDATHRAVISEKIRDVVAVAPFRSPAWVARVPDVVAAGPADDRTQFHAGCPEPIAEVVVFAAPAFIVFIEAVDAFVIGPPESEIAAQKARLGRMTNEVIPAGFAVVFGQSAALLAT